MLACNTTPVNSSQGSHTTKTSIIIEREREREREKEREREREGEREWKENGEYFTRAAGSE